MPFIRSARRSRGVVILVVLSLPVCAAVGARAQDSEPAPASPARTFEAKGTDGMTYKAFREQVVASGWTSVPNSLCSQTVEAETCEALPEIDMCSLDGHCAMTFGHPNEDIRLIVGAQGRIARWDSSDGADFRLGGWRYD